MTNPEKSFRVGLIGTGRISDIYLKTLKQYEGIDVTACGSLNLDESRAKAAEYDIQNVATPDDIIADPNLDAILNLTIPAAHAEVSLAALNAGKHVYSEKPLVSHLAEGRKILDRASALGLTVGTIAGTINVIRGTGEIYFDSLSVLIFLLLI